MVADPEKRDPRAWAWGIAGAVAAFTALEAIGLATQSFGWTFVVGGPFVCGLIVGRWVRVERVLQVLLAVTAAGAVILGAVTTSLAGLVRVWAYVSLAAVPLIAGVFLRRKSRGRLELVCGALILAGTLGNGWDRAVLQYVRDFLLIPLIPNFNLADAMLTCSIAVLSLHWILHERRPLRPVGPAEARQPDDGGVGDLGRDHGPRP